MCFLIWEMPEVSDQSAGFYMAVHRIMDGFGLEGTLKSISWAWFSCGGLLVNPDFVFHRQNSASKEVPSPSGMCYSCPIPCFQSFLPGFRSPLLAHISECGADSQQCSKGQTGSPSFPLRCQQTLSCSAQPLLYGKAL